jgi:glucose-1-phosphate cytidylyltransferase
MKIVILVCGLGARLQEETFVKPKPVIEIDGKPILWHIMKIYILTRHLKLTSLGYETYWKPAAAAPK